ncbi:MAG: molybdenum cofactor guanylyltransferase [Polyangiaceae bacterium]|nr:molybdenum cofactor guanylyltransferase [Polyangiaceae bacterium]
MISGLGAVVLCGGKSSRMGRSKALLPFGEETLISRVVRRIATVASPIVVVLAPEQPEPDLPIDVRFVRDEVEGRGPLLGLSAGLQALNGLVESCFVSSTDVPFIHPSLISTLEEMRRSSNLDAVVPHAFGHYHPLSSVMCTHVLSVVESLIQSNLMRPYFIFERTRTRFVTEAELKAHPDVAANDPNLLSLQNVNTPEEYERALAAAGLLVR